jgi:hypothetical protein
MRKPVRSMLLALTCLGVAVAPSSFAATGPASLVVADPAGDAVAAGTAFDITAITLTTTGQKEGKTYRPKSIVVSLTLAAPPSAQAGATYGVDVDLAGCGYANFSYTPGATLGEGSVFTECGSPEDETGSTATLYQQAPKVKGNVITWTVGVKTPGFKPGTAVTGINAFTTFNEPVFGLLGPTLVDKALSFDVAETEKRYVIG